MPHAVLLGDSIFDNGPYVRGGSPVVEQLRGRMPRDWQVTLLARDGAVAIGVLSQLQQLPPDATHLILSAGGNDALQCSGLVRNPAADAGEMLAELAAAQKEFRDEYRQVINALQQTGLPVIACTIYDAIPGLSEAERMGLSIFNDVIVREQFAARNVVVDLRQICTEARDYSSVSPIEPSEIGGAKITSVLQKILTHQALRHEDAAWQIPLAYS